MPVVIPDTTSLNPATSSLNWIYGKNVTFSQSVVVRAPVFATGNLSLQGSATIAETIPADVNNPQRPNSVNVVGTVTQANVGNANNNHIGNVDTHTSPGWGLGDTTLSPPAGGVWIGTGQCAIANQNGGALHACVYNSTAATADWIFQNRSVQTVLDLPDMSCCDPVGYAAPVVTYPEPTVGAPTVMGFWYSNADIGPKSPCLATDYATSGSISPPLTFDKQGVAANATGASDGLIDQSATRGTAAFNLTPKNAAYYCTSQDGQHWLRWNGTSSTWNGIPPNELDIQGVTFIDGSATVTAGTNGTQPAIYKGQGALILSGTFLMQTGSALCIAVSGSSCNTTAAWDPNKAGMYVFALGDFGTDASTQNQNSYAGFSIEINKGQYMGGLFGAKVVDAAVSGTVVDGPMISAYDNVNAGQSGDLRFPAIAFPTSGSDGFTGPLPVARLLTPRYFAGG